MGKCGHQTLTEFWRADPALASAEAHEKFVSRVLMQLCYVYKDPKAKVSHPWAGRPPDS